VTGRRIARRLPSDVAAGGSFFLALLCAALPSIGAQAAAKSDDRQRILMDAGWRFQMAPPLAPLEGTAITNWQWLVANREARRATTPPAGTDDAWKPAKIGDDPFDGHPGFVWMRATLPALAGPNRVLRFDSVDDNATVFLNGKRLVHHEGWNDTFLVDLDPAWNASGPNEVVVLVENGEGPGGIRGAVTLGLKPAPRQEDDPTSPDFVDNAWRTVHLPHDYVIEGTFTPTADAGHGSLPVAPAWYRKTFTLPASYKGKSVWIDFDGVYRDAKVYLNGKLLGAHPGGYTSFRFDISQAARFGGGAKNVLAVSVDPRHAEGWWYEGGGIYRHVWLNVADPVHVAPWGTFVTAQLPEPKEGVAPSAATVTIKTTLANAGASAPVRLVSRVIDDTGKAVGDASANVLLPASGSQEETQQVSVPSPHLWSLEAPRMYRLVTLVQRAGKTIDTCQTPFGIRTIRFDPNQGFFLNGKHVMIQGVCNHQDHAGVGTAIPDSLQDWRVKRLKEIGCNAWRMSHNPPAAELLDACDRQGVLVMDENRHLGDTFNAKTGRGTPYEDMSELDSMILRDRNHPSIILWSMCNEEPLQGTEEGTKIFSAMQTETQRLDPTRPVTCAMNDGAHHGIATVEAVRGFNYGPGVYPSYHAAHPDLPLYGSEIGSTTTTRGIYADDKEKGYVRAYDSFAPPWAQTAEDTWQPMAENAFMAGGFVWTGFDYKGEPTPYGWPCVNSHFGILDMCGFEKDTARYYETVWKDEPQVHLLPHWNWSGQEGKPISVWAYSNADSVELFLNGASLGKQEMPRYRHLEWSVPYAPGKLEAKAYRNGKVIASDTVETAGVAADIRLIADRARFAADGEDVVPVEVDIVDAQGRVVPTADNRVTFTVVGKSGTGEVVGVGNGDPSDHDPDKANSRKAFNGKCQVLIGAAERDGAVTVQVTSPGLKTAIVTLTARKAR